MNINQTDYSTLQAIKKQIDHIVECYHVRLNFEDIFGICNFSAEIEKTFSPYSYHNNKFCNYIKNDKTCFYHCAMNKSRVVARCSKLKKPFFGTCYMGISELVYPIVCKNKLVAVILIGQFYSDNKRKNVYRLNRAVQKYNLPEIKANEYYENIMQDHNIPEQLLIDISLLCKLILLLLYEHGFDTKNNEKLTRFYNNHIIQNVIKMIHDNYDKELSLSLLSAQCYCSPSYLSRLVKKETGMTITDYINMVRTNHAKSLLNLTSLSVTDIGNRVGFHDVAYFSKVFKKHVGMTPKEYRLIC